MQKQLVSLLVILMIAITATAQTNTESEEKQSLDNGTIQNQFDYMVNESSTYQEYKVIKQYWLNKFKSHLSDSLKAASKKLKETQQTVSSQKNEIHTLNAELKQVNDDLARVTNEKNSIEFLGNPMHKAAYNSLMWTIIAGLLALLVFFILKFKRSNMVTTQTKKTLTETQDAFEAHRKRALEREEKLHVELNKFRNKMAKS